MVKYCILILSLATLSVRATGCDICGCGVGNNYTGILPDFYKHIFGVRYRHNAMLTHVGVGGSETYLTTQEGYDVAEAWSGWNIGSRWRLMAAVPYSFNKRTNGGVAHLKNGLGDITVAGYYALLNKRQTLKSERLLLQSLWLGVGVKTPTGNYNPNDKSLANSNANLFQLGTGSYDVLLNGMYDIRLQDFGVNVSASYKLSNSNQYGYRYGNKFNLTTQAYYKFRVLHKISVAPNAGVLYEKAASDNDNGYNVTVSGGNALLATAGAELAFGKLALGANYQTALQQALAHGIVKAKDRFMLHVAVSL